MHINHYMYTVQMNVNNYLFYCQNSDMRLCLALCKEQYIRTFAVAFDERLRADTDRFV